jgi:NADH-quinone oxidoreductase subunit F
MPALPEEIEAAENEGIKIHPLTLPVKIIGSAGKVTGIECISLELREFDKSGRRVPQPIPDSHSLIGTDIVIEAVGQRPDISYLDGSGIQFNRNGTIKVDRRTLCTDTPGFFAGGDAVAGPQTVSEAIAAGQRAASSIKRYLQGLPLTQRIDHRDCEQMPVPRIAPTEEELQHKERVVISSLALTSRLNSFAEIENSYTREEAITEASRCLRCDLQGESPV